MTDQSFDAFSNSIARFATRKTPARATPAKNTFRITLLTDRWLKRGKPVFLNTGLIYRKDAHWSTPEGLPLCSAGLDANRYSRIPPPPYAIDCVANRVFER